MDEAFSLFDLEALDTGKLEPLVQVPIIAKQISRDSFNALTFVQQLRLSRALNHSTDIFIPCIIKEELPKSLNKRRKDAIEENLIPPKAPNGHHWCPYCGIYRPFRDHNGYTRCIACGISTMDFYTRYDNKK